MAVSPKKLALLEYVSTEVSDSRCGTQDLLAKELVEGLEPGEDHRALHHLDVPLAQAVEVGADSNAPPRHLHDRFEC